MGALADRMVRRNVTVAGVVLTALLVSQVGAIRTPGSLLLLLTVAVLGSAILHPAGSIEAAPRQLDVGAVRRDLSSTDGVADVHDLHVWTITSGVLAMSAHVELEDGSHWTAVLSRLAHVLQQHHGITHISLQPEEAREHLGAFRGCSLHSTGHSHASLAPASIALRHPVPVMLTSTESPRFRPDCLTRVLT